MTIKLEEAIASVELVQEERIEKMASFQHGVIAVRLGRYLDAYVDEHNLGYVADSSTTFQVAGNPPKREPDVAFVSLERMPNIIDEEVPFAPDLAVEVISGSDDWKAIVAKANQYLQAGTRLVWVVDPYTKSVFVFRPDNQNLLTLSSDDELDGLDVVPGFKLKIGVLFKQLNPK